MSELAIAEAAIRADEREKCAKLVEPSHWSKPDKGEQWWASDYASAALVRAAAAIRAREEG